MAGTPVAAMIVRVAADISDLKTGVAGIDSTLQGVVGTARSMAGALSAAFAASGIKDAAAEAVASASRIHDAAQRIGVSAEAVQKLQFAAEQGGSSLDAVATAMGKMSNVLGGPGGADALKAVGLSFEDIKGLGMDQTFAVIADAIAKVPGPMKQSEVTTNLFGRGALELLPAIKAGIVAVGDAAPVMANQTVAALEKSGDQWEAVERQLNNLKARALAPLLSTFLELPPTLQTVAGGIAAFTPSLESLGLGVLALGGPAGAWAALKGAILAILPFFTTTIPAAFSAILPFLGPIGLIAAGVGAVILAWKYWDQITGFVSGVYTAIKTWIVDKVIPILQKGGGLLLPVEGVLAVWRNWDQITGIAQRVYDGVKSWLVDKFQAVVDAIKGKIDAVTGFFSNMYDKVVGHSFVPDMIARIQEEFGKLREVMVEPTEAAIGNVIGLFSDGFHQVQSIFRDFKDGTRTTIDHVNGYFEGMGQASRGVTRIMAGDMSGWKDAIVGSIQQVASAVRLVMDLFNGNKGRDLVKDFAASFGGFDALHAKLLLLGDAGEELWIKLTQGVGRNNPAEARQAIDEVRRALESLPAEVIVGVRFNADEVPDYRGGEDVDHGPGYAAGTQGRFVDFGSGTWTRLHGRERIMTEAEGRAGGGGPVRIITQLVTVDRRMLAEVMSETLLA